MVYYFIKGYNDAQHVSYLDDNSLWRQSCW